MKATDCDHLAHCVPRRGVCSEFRSVGAPAHSGALQGNLDLRTSSPFSIRKDRGLLRVLAGAIGASLNEGTPVAIIEAMAAGRAVVATAVGGVPDVVRDGETGLLIPQGEPSALAAAVIRLSNAELRQRLGARAREDVAQRYAGERLVADVAALYADLLRQRTEEAVRRPAPETPSARSG